MKFFRLWCSLRIVFGDTTYFGRLPKPFVGRGILDAPFGVRWMLVHRLGCCGGLRRVWEAAPYRSRALRKTLF